MELQRVGGGNQRSGVKSGKQQGWRTEKREMCWQWRDVLLHAPQKAFHLRVFASEKSDQQGVGDSGVCVWRLPASAGSLDH